MIDRLHCLVAKRLTVVRAEQEKMRAAAKPSPPVALTQAQKLEQQMAKIKQDRAAAATPPKMPAVRAHALGT